MQRHDVASTLRRRCIMSCACWDGFKSYPHKELKRLLRIHYCWNIMDTIVWTFCGILCYKNVRKEIRRFYQFHQNFTRANIWRQLLLDCSYTKDQLILSKWNAWKNKKIKQNKTYIYIFFSCAGSYMYPEQYKDQWLLLPHKSSWRWTHWISVNRPKGNNPIHENRTKGNNPVILVIWCS